MIGPSSFIHFLKLIWWLGENCFTMLCWFLPHNNTVQPSVRSVTQLCPTLWDPMDCSTPGLPYPSPTPRVLNSSPLSWWCHPTILSSVVPFSSFPQSFPASGSFPMSQLFTSGGQRIGVSVSTSVLPMNTQDWSNITLNRYQLSTFWQIFSKLVLPSESPLLQGILKFRSTPLAQGGFPSVQKLFLLHDSLPPSGHKPTPSTQPCPEILCLLLCLYLLPYLFLRRLAFIFWRFGFFWHLEFIQ